MSSSALQPPRENKPRPQLSCKVSGTSIFVKFVFRTQNSVKDACFVVFFSSHCLRAAAFYIRGLLSFFQGRYNEAKYWSLKCLTHITRSFILYAFKNVHIRLCCRRFLRETLKMSNAEDLNRLTACSLVLLGHIFYVLGNHRVRITKSLV